MKAKGISRRRFLVTTALAGGGLAVGFAWYGSEQRAPFEPESGAFAPNAFLQITPDNSVYFYCPRDEMGQGVTTGLATVLAEDLDVEPWAMRVELVGAHPAYENPEFGAQVTGGSTSIRAHYLTLREAGATARNLIIKAAAEALGMRGEDLSTSEGHVIAKGERHPYGRFVASAGKLTADDDMALKPAGEFKYIGREFPRLDALAKSTGTAVFGIDIDVPDMVHGVVLRCPVAGGEAVAFDASVAEAMLGVVTVLKITAGVAVVADRYWRAREAARAVTVDWRKPALAEWDSRRIRADLERALGEEAGLVDDASGEAGERLAGAATRVEGTYWTPYLAHAPMEPMNAIVRIGKDDAEVWSGTQSPALAQGVVARVAGFSPDQVRVHSAYLGGGFGRRTEVSHIVEAAEIARAVGRPAKVLWTREDDIRHGYYRPASVVRMEAGLDAGGRIVAWQAKRAGGDVTPAMVASWAPGMVTFAPDAALDLINGAVSHAFDNWMADSRSTEGLAEDYDLPDREVRNVAVNHGLPLTFWRGVGHSYTAFAKECFMDELAEAVGVAPDEFRRRHCTGQPRLEGVIARVSERVKALAEEELPGRFGYAAHGSFGSYVAQAAQVSLDGDQVRVHRVICAFDCGQIINPDIVRGQVEGAIVYGLTAALFGNIGIENGAVRESNFHDYPVLRIDQTPAIEVILVPSEEAPGGVGETALPPIAPAVANALYAVTGKRLRELPLKAG